MLLYKQLKSRICHNRHSGNFAASVISCIRFSDLWHSVFVWNEYAVIISQNPFFYTKRNGIKISYGYDKSLMRHHSRIWNLIKICGYIILFSIFCEMLQTLPFPAHWFSLAATGFLEVTNGVALLSTSACTRHIKSLLAVLFLSWGGLSGIFSGLFHPSPDRPLAPELCITENNPLTVNRWMLYSFTFPGHPHLKLKYW